MRCGAELLRRKHWDCPGMFLHLVRLASGDHVKSGCLLYVNLWGDGVCMVKKGCDADDPDFVHGLRPKPATL